MSHPRAERDGDQTSVTLLELVRKEPPDQLAWTRFVERYTPMVEAWCRGRGLRDADLDDATQLVLIKLSRLLTRFQYDPTRSFRSWLRVVAENVCRDWWTSLPPVSGNLESLPDLEARDDLARRLEEQYDLEIFEMAKFRTKSQVSAQTWTSFTLTAIDGLSGAQAASRLGIQVATVLKAKSNVIKRIKAEAFALELGLGAPPGPGGL